jgi:hypothetical protein
MIETQDESIVPHNFFKLADHGDSITAGETVFIRVSRQLSSVFG